MGEFAVSRTEAILSETMYMLGLAFGLHDYGAAVRVYWASLAGLHCNLVEHHCLRKRCWSGKEFRHLFSLPLSLRFILGSARVAIGAGTILDVWGDRHQGGELIASLLFICGPFFGPSLGPLVGTYVMDEYHGDWRWSAVGCGLDWSTLLDPDPLHEGDV